jgi:hypothetical protein
MVGDDESKAELASPSRGPDHPVGAQVILGGHHKNDAQTPGHRERDRRAKRVDGQAGGPQEGALQDDRSPQVQGVPLWPGTDDNVVHFTEDVL